MAAEKATPKARIRQTKALTPPPTSNTRARLPHQSVKAQGVDRLRREKKVTTRSRTVAVEVGLVRVGVVDQVEETETGPSQRFINTMRLKNTLTVMRCEHILRT